MAIGFIHLNLHSEYSLVDGIVRIKPLLDALVNEEMPAIALTDQSNIFALVKFHRACLAKGVKPVHGADVWVDVPVQDGKQKSVQPCRVILLCKNNQGYLNLKTLISRSYLHNQHQGKARISLDDLSIYADGLIALIGKGSDVGAHLISDKYELAKERIKYWQKLFPESLYLELQRTQRAHDEYFVEQAVKLAAELAIPVVATNEVRFLKADDFDVHEARVCINEGRILTDKHRPRNYSDQQYLKSAAEMHDLFEDIPQALQNTVEIAKRCNVTLQLGENFLPDFPIPDGLTMDAFFRKTSSQGLEKRLLELFDPESPDFNAIAEKYRDRLNTELDVIIQMGFPGYFLIVADFIQWAKKNGVPVGPGRGSGAGSLVAYALTITDLDPLQYDLLFERFLNPERVSMPDFDVDFCMEGRDRVIDYVAETYGRDRVSQIITYGSMAAKAAIRDVGRVQGLGYGFVDSIAKLIPMELGITLSKALEQEEELKQRYESDETVRELVDMAMSLEGITRNVGKHAGGVVISPQDINVYAPIYCEQGSQSIVTQFDKDDVEAVGLVKFDFLGLKTLTVIDWALDIINARKHARGEDEVDIARIPLDDADSFKTLKSSNTTAVFQLESRGMKELISRLQPDCFEDIVALVALFRPGPLQSGMVDDFIDRKHGRKEVEYPHPWLEPILKPTYGTILYQEQVMQISQVLAGYTLGGADLLRRAMGKKKPEVMAQQRGIFEEGAVGKGVDKALATQIFDQMEKFAAYGFNKSHSAAYALVSYQTLWLKTHYVEAFMAAVLSADMENTDKVVTIIEECREANLKLAAPDVNLSEYRFTVSDDKVIIYGLGAIKGVGEGAIQSILDSRNVQGKFHDLQDFCNRIDLRKVNQRVLQTLVRAGALDGLDANRATLYNAIPLAMKAADQFNKAEEKGQGDLFGGDLFAPSASNGEAIASQFPKIAEWNDDERLQNEKETLGLYLTGHPIDQYLPELRQFTTHRISELNPDKKQNIVIAGLIIARRVINTRRGDPMEIITIDDRSGRQEIVLFSDKLAAFRNFLIKDTVIVVAGEMSLDSYNNKARINVEKIYDMDLARNRFARHLQVRLEQHAIDDMFLRKLEEVLTPFLEGGECPISCLYQSEEASAVIALSNKWRVNLSKELLHRLEQLTHHPGRIVY